MSVGWFPTDPAFPQLKIATDPGLMKETFRTHLRPVDGKVYDIEDCRFIRLRYRQDSRRFLLYTLRLVEPDTGRELDVQVTGLVYAEKDKAEQTWRKLKATDPQQEIPDGWLTFEPVSFVPELGMLVQVFPYDRRLPTLPLLAAGSTPRARACASWPVWTGRLARPGVEGRVGRVPGTGGLCCATRRGPETLRQGEEERKASTPRYTATKRQSKPTKRCARCGGGAAPMEKVSP